MTERPAQTLASGIYQQVVGWAFNRAFNRGGKPPLPAGLPSSSKEGYQVLRGAQFPPRSPAPEDTAAQRRLRHNLKEASPCSCLLSPRAWAGSQSPSMTVFITMAVFGGKGKA